MKAQMLKTFLLASLSAACGGDEESVTVSQDSGASLPAEAGMCQAESCTCGALVGLRYCDAAGALGACQCAAPAVDAAVTSSEGSCWAGLYQGNFEGSAGFLITTTPVTGLDFMAGKPALELTIGGPSAVSEFVVIGSGVMRGNANGTFPFEAEITGDLNCQTKQFEATIVGHVQLFLDGIRNDFTGTMVANYDANAHAFVGGMWTVTGSNADGGADFGLTGNGKWSADYALADGGVADGGLDAAP